MGSDPAQEAAAVPTIAIPTTAIPTTVVPTTAIPTTVIPTTGQWAIGLISVFRDHRQKQCPFPESRHFALCRQRLF